MPTQLREASKTTSPFPSTTCKLKGILGGQILLALWGLRALWLLVQWEPLKQPEGEETERVPGTEQRQDLKKKIVNAIVGFKIEKIQRVYGSTLPGGSRQY